jgi:ribonuclease P protein component
MLLFSCSLTVFNVALPKVHRLRHRKEFSAVYQSGLRRNSAHLTLRALRRSGSYKGNSDLSVPDETAIDPPPSPTRIGISISQKVSKRATVRNRIKRQIRAIMQQFLPQIGAGWQVVVIVRPGATQCDYQQFLQELKQLLVDAEVIDGHQRGCLL